LAIEEHDTTKGTPLLFARKVYTSHKAPQIRKSACAEARRRARLYSTRDAPPGVNFFLAFIAGKAIVRNTYGKTSIPVLFRPVEH
jgi:hypothetical protein